MQHRYVGDIGDYLKLSLLKAVQSGHQLGVAWCLYPNEDRKSDGGHIKYLDRAAIWRHFDPEVFDYLRAVAAGERNVAALESAQFLADTKFASETVPRAAKDREAWLEAIAHRFTDRNVVFFDPDNGLEPPTFSPGTSKAGKSIRLSEVRRFKREARSLIVYHHQSRFRGGHVAEIAYWTERLSQDFSSVDAVRCKPWSPRVYFLLDASPEIRRRAQLLCEQWQGKMQWNPHL